MIQIIKKESLCKVSTGTRKALKCSNYPAEKSQHRFFKFLVCDWCWENKIDFMTEVVFNNNQRADIVILDWKVAIEILNSEERLTKTKHYPIPTIPIKIKGFPIDMIKKEIELMLMDLQSCNGSNADYYIKKYGGV